MNHEDDIAPVPSPGDAGPREADGTPAVDASAEPDGREPGAPEPEGGAASSRPVEPKPSAVAGEGAGEEPSQVSRASGPDGDPTPDTPSLDGPASLDGGPALGAGPADGTGPDPDDDPGSRPRHVPEESAPAPRGPRRVSWRRVGVGVAGLVAVAATAGAVLVVPDAVPAQPSAAPAGQSVAVTPTAERWVCPGPARLTDPEAVGDAQFSPSPVDTASALSAFVRPPDSPAVLTGIGGAGPVPLIPGEDAATTSGVVLAGGSVLSVTPDAGSSSVDAVASVSSLTTAGDLRGLVAATCTPPGVSRWLVGGSTEVGSSAQLVLQNPGDTPTTVRIEVWGPGGPVALGSGALQVVAPGSETVTLLEASAPEQSRIAVHVSATGGLIGAYIQHNTLDGLVPQGVDDVVAGAEPSTRLAVAGIVTTGVGVEDPHAPRLRLLAPEVAATAHVVVLGADGPVRLRGAEDVALQAGVVTDVSLGGLPAGTYGVAIESDVPIVAGAVADRQGEPSPDLLHTENQYDRAWIAAQDAAVPDADDEAATPYGGVALVSGASGMVTIGAVPTAALDPTTDVKPNGRFVGTLRAYDAAGTEIGSVGVRVAAGTATTLDAATLAADGTVPAMVALEGSGAAAGALPVWSVLVAAGPTDGASTDPSLISVLVPARPVDSGATVVVRASDRLGLPD